METRINKPHIIALGIGITFGGLLTCLLGIHGLVEWSLILSIGLLMGPISLIIASVVALFHPRIGGWWLIITGFTTGALLYFGDPYDEIFVCSLWSMPQIAAGVLWLGSGTPLAKCPSRKDVLKGSISLVLLLIIVFSFFTLPYMSAKGWGIFSEERGWSAWMIASGDDLTLVWHDFPISPTIDFILRMGPRACLLGFFFILVGLPGMFNRRLKKSNILILVGSMIITIFVFVDGVWLIGGGMEFRYWGWGGGGPFSAGLVYHPGIGLALILIGAILIDAISLSILHPESKSRIQLKEITKIAKGSAGVFVLLLFVSFISWGGVSCYYNHLSELNGPYDELCDVCGEHAEYDVKIGEKGIHEYCDEHAGIWSIIHPFAGLYSMYMYWTEKEELPPSTHPTWAAPIGLMFFGVVVWGLLCLSIHITHPSYRTKTIPLIICTFFCLLSIIFILYMFL